MTDSLNSARLTAEYAGAEREPFWRDFWLKRSEWHMANAVGWASR